MDTSSEPPSLWERLGGRPKVQVFLNNFYATVRIHHRLGPIFEAHIGDWPSHIEKVLQFWALQTGAAESTYRGGFAAAHFRAAVPPHLVEDWLKIWRNSARAHFEATEAEELIAIAERLGGRLVHMLASAPPLPPTSGGSFPMAPN